MRRARDPRQSDSRGMAVMYIVNVGINYLPARGKEPIRVEASDKPQALPGLPKSAAVQWLRDGVIEVAG